MPDPAPVMSSASYEGSAEERAALSGDRSAWNALIVRHQRQVVLSLISAGVRPAQAKEFANDAWLKLMERADDRRLAFLQLPGLVVKQALFLARSAGRRLDTPPEPFAVDVDSAESSFLTRERLMRARQRVETLSGSSRAVFLQLYSEPTLSHAELAQRVGLSVQRVRQIICEVRKVLRTEVEP